MTAPQRRGGALLTGIAVGAVLGAVALLGPARGLAPGLDALAAPAPAPSTEPSPSHGIAAPPMSAAPALTPPSPATRPAHPAPPARPTAAPRAPRRTSARVAAPGPSLLTDSELKVVTLTNAQRAQAGCGSLRVDARLTSAARGHSSDMAVRGYFEHDSPEGASFSDRETAAGYPDPGGENIAVGQQSAAEVMSDWMGSDGHRRNILDCSFATIGVGLDTRGMYWTQDFGR